MVAMVKENSAQGKPATEYDQFAQELRSGFSQCYVCQSTTFIKKLEMRIDISQELLAVRGSSIVLFASIFFSLGRNGRRDRNGDSEA